MAIVSLNGGAIDDTAELKCGCTLATEAVASWYALQDLARLHDFLAARVTCGAHEIGQAYNMLLANTTPQIEMWNEPHDINEQWEDCE